MSKTTDVPTKDELSDERQDTFADTKDIFHILADAISGTPPDTGTTIRNTYPGSTKADALGRAYSFRDTLEDAGATCDVTYIEPRYTCNKTLYHEITVTVTDTE